MAAYMGKDVNRLKNKGGKWKYMSEKEMLDHSAKFAPYRFVYGKKTEPTSTDDRLEFRSLFMWYMWRIEDVNVDAIQNQ